MIDQNTVGVWATFIVGMAVGALANWVTRPEGERDLPCAAGDDEIGHPLPVARVDTVDGTRAYGTSFLTAALREHFELVSVIGTPVGWPDEVPVAFRPEAVQAALALAVSACAAARPAQYHLDCEEYPCLLWAEVPEGASFFHGLQDCMEWPYVGRRQDVTTYTDADVGQVTYWTVDLRYPGDGVDEGNLELRRRYRTETSASVVLDEWNLPVPEFP